MTHGAAVADEPLVRADALDVGLDGTARDPEDRGSLRQREGEPQVRDDRLGDEREHGEGAEMLDGFEQDGTAEQARGPTRMRPKPLPLLGGERVVALQLDERQGTAVEGVGRAVDGRHTGATFQEWHGRVGDVCYTAVADMKQLKTHLSCLLRVSRTAVSDVC